MLKIHNLIQSDEEKKHTILKFQVKFTQNTPFIA